MDIGAKIKKMTAAWQQRPDARLDEIVGAGMLKQAAKPGISASSNDMIAALTGSIATSEHFYFPPDIIGGTCPRIHGEEQEIVWNAAAEACDTERVHVVWQAVGNRIWYLAVRSADLASNANSWCPLAALLPTEADKDKLPLCYTYFGEELAVLMVIGAEELHIFRGTAAVIRAKAERSARELGQLTVVNIDLFVIEKMTPVPWYSVSLFEDRARRILAAISVLASLSIVALSFLVWLSASMSMVSSRHDLAGALDRTQTKSMQLVREAEGIRSSPMRDQIERFLSINEGLLSLNGYLNVYEIKNKVTRWRALVPASATADRISSIGGKNIESNDKGVVIGNDAEIQYEATREKK